jgi:signal transduction histidine kinase
MPNLLKNNLLIGLLLIPFFTCLIVSIVILPIIGATAFHILTLGAVMILASMLFGYLTWFILNLLNRRHIKDLITQLDPAIINDSYTKPLLNSNNDTQAASELINTFAKSYQQWYSTSQKLDSILLAEREKFLWSAKNTTDPIIILDLRLNITFVNQAAEKILGLDPTLTKGQSLEQILKFQGLLGEISINKLAPLKSPGFDGVLFNQNEVKVISLLNNKEAFTNITTTQIKHGNYINLACIITFHDVTAEKQLEAMKLDFISMAAHELRTPLTSIKGYMSVFIQENEKKLSEDQMMFIRRISNSAQQLSALVENLLGVSRVERGAMTITTQPMDWNNTLQIAFEQFEHRAQEKRLDLKYLKSKTPLPTVQADNVRINEVINNFLANACNYTEPGGKITLWAEFKDNYIITHVQDTGRGLPKEAIDHLFTKFYRVPGNLEQASKGNGLGLYISKAIVELHHGKIWVESPGPGKGSTFSFSLPVVETKGMDLNVLTKKL